MRAHATNQAQAANQAVGGDGATAGSGAIGGGAVGGGGSEVRGRMTGMALIIRTYEWGGKGGAVDFDRRSRGSRHLDVMTGEDPRDSTTPSGSREPDPPAPERDRDVAIGVGPHPRPWPDDPRLDPELLAAGDRRNVLDEYRYWSNAAIVADLDTRRHRFHIAIENWQHDMNIGTVVRTANAFLAAEVHIIGRRRWNRRGAMVTDRYQHIRHHATVDDFVAFAADADLPVIGIDILPGSVPLERTVLPARCVLLFGQEGPGLSAAARDASTQVCSIAQFGSTRSINAGVAAGIAMHAWIREHADVEPGLPPSQ